MFVAVFSIPILSCFAGSKARLRYNSCGLMPQNDEQQCGRAPYHGEWSLWAGCSQTCGGGDQRRVRKGYCGGVDETQVKSETSMFRNYV